jgi:hypothetical protein
MIKKVIILGLVVLTLAATSLTAFALTNASTPAEILSNLTGKTVEEVTEEKIESNKTYGALASDEGLWEEFKEEMLKSKKAFLDEKVTDGTITQDEADTIYNNIEERQELCNGNGEGYGGMMGYGFGNGGRGLGQGQGQGRGCGRAWQ